MKTFALNLLLFVVLKHKQMFVEASRAAWTPGCVFKNVIIFFFQIAREAEAAMFHRQMFEELRRTSHLTRDPTETVAIGAVEASFKCCASAIIVLTKSGR